MWVVYIGRSMNSAWDRQDYAEKQKRVLEGMGKTDVYVKQAREFGGMFPNGYLFN